MVCSGWRVDCRNPQGVMVGTGWCVEDGFLGWVGLFIIHYFHVFMIDAFMYGPGFIMCLWAKPLMCLRDLHTESW